MSKKYVVFSIIAGLIFLGIIIFVAESEAKKIKNAPLISYKTSLNTEVKTISFKRNGLYINDTMYYAGAISWYSEIKNKDSVATLDKIKTPFRLFKLENNDTLQIIKGNIKFYLLVSKELGYTKEKFDKKQKPLAK